MEKVFGNGATTIQGEDGRWVDSEGRYGYNAFMTGAYVCYTCGHLCDCGVVEE